MKSSRLLIFFSAWFFVTALAVYVSISLRDAARISGHAVRSNIAAHGRGIGARSCAWPAWRKHASVQGARL